MVQNFDGGKFLNIWKILMKIFLTNSIILTFTFISSLCSWRDWWGKTVWALIMITPCAKMWSGYVRLQWNNITLCASVDYEAFIYSKLSDLWISCNKENWYAPIEEELYCEWEIGQLKKSWYIRCDGSGKPMDGSFFFTGWRYFSNDIISYVHLYSQKVTWSHEWMSEWLQAEHHETRQENERWNCETTQNFCWYNTVASVD